ncbi:transposase [Streptomyces sp. NPDC000348]|uniref:transposase n=1 Tax=Streptomyces sp. NPDC000348 TaxID=3364538 RepID=UPI0036AB6152
MADLHGVDMDGRKDVLGLRGGDGGEGATTWMTVLPELRNRAVEDVCVVARDGLKGLPDTVTATWPRSTVQTDLRITGDLREVMVRDSVRSCRSPGPRTPAGSASTAWRSSRPSPRASKCNARRSAHASPPASPCPTTPAARSREGLLHKDE